MSNKMTRIHKLRIYNKYVIIFILLLINWQINVIINMYKKLYNEG